MSAETSLDTKSVSEGHLKRNIVVKTVEMRDGECEEGRPKILAPAGSGRKPGLAYRRFSITPKSSSGRLWKRGRSPDIIPFPSPYTKGSLDA